MTFQLSSQAARGAALSCAVLLASCSGGGGSAPPITLGGKVYGLSPGSALELGLQDGSAALTVSTNSFLLPESFSVGSTYSQGTAYALSVVRHPQGQLCRIVGNAAGVLNAAQQDVRVECHRTVLNDTGIQSSSAALNASPALAPDAMVGRDAEAARLTKVGTGAFGFDFTRLCRSGVAVAVKDDSCPVGTVFGAANEWTCTQDNVTGLVWFKDTQVHDPATAAPLDGVCGRTGWRAPKVRELLSLVHAGRTDPAEAAIDLDHFPGTPAAAFRAEEVYLDGDGSPWVVHFGQRGAAVNGVLGDTLRQRWVASPGASPLADTSSTDYQRGGVGAGWVVVDMPRELMWLVPAAAPTAVAWTAAVAAANTVNTAQAGGHSDWRLPNRAELESLVKRSTDAPALDASIYGADAAGFSQLFWSASPGIANQGQDTAWVIDFRYGDLSLAMKSGQARTLFVRNKVFNTTP